MLKRFVDTPETKTDDIGYLSEVFSRVAMPYFLVIGSSSRLILEKESRQGLINIGYSLTGAALLAIDPKKGEREKDTPVNTSQAEFY
jgi:hypothetical protein